MPTEYEQGLASIQRRRAIAEAMQARALSPLDAPLSGTGNYPIQTKISPLQVISQLGQAFIARKQNQKLDKEYADIAKAMASSKSKALQDLMIPQDMAPSYEVDSTQDDSQGPTRMIQKPGNTGGGPNLAAAQNAIDSGIDPQVVAASLRAGKTENEPNSVREYEYAKKNGYKGTFEQWTIAGGQSSRPSSVKEWEFFRDLTPEDQDRYLVMKRAQQSSVEDLGGGKGVVTRKPTGGTTVTPLTTAQTEIDAAAAKKKAEAEAAAVGGGQGNIIAEINKKGANAQTINAVLDIADPLIDVATGSAIGAGVDKLAGVFGSAPDGAQAIAQLKVLQAGLMLNQPRMEGPQSDRDVQLYREAAASLGEPSVTREAKKAALQTIRQLQQRYTERAAPEAPAKKRYNPATGKIE